MTEVRAKKALGQHFLTDLNIARKICDSLSGGTSSAPCPVLEVGCGMGVLFVAAGIGMVYNEMKKKRCRHLDEVNRHQIP